MEYIIKYIYEHYSQYLGIQVLKALVLITLTFFHLVTNKNQAAHTEEVTVQRDTDGTDYFCSRTADGAHHTRVCDLRMGLCAADQGVKGGYDEHKQQLQKILKIKLIE